jgi:hypothetical protein
MQSNNIWKKREKKKSQAKLAHSAGNYREKEENKEGVELKWKTLQHTPLLSE